MVVTTALRFRMQSYDIATLFAKHCYSYRINCYLCIIHMSIETLCLNYL